MSRDRPVEVVWARQRTEDITCTRCQGLRAIPVPYIPLDRYGRGGAPQGLTEGGYACLRCRGVLAGRAVSDPVGSQVQQDARAQAGERLRERRSQA